MYFSAHGIEHQGQRLILPYDFDVEYPGDTGSLLGDQQLLAFAEKSAARSIVFLVDACREGVAVQFVPDYGAKSAPPIKIDSNNIGKATKEDVPTVAVVFGCASGEECHWDTIDNVRVSLFTHALSEILRLEDEDAGSSVLDIVRAAQSVLDGHLRPGLKQTITLGALQISGRAGPPGELLIKDNPAAAFRARVDASRWCARLRENPLWTTIQAGGDTLAYQVSAIVLRSEDWFRQAEISLPKQRWRRKDLSERFLDRITLLIDLDDSCSQHLEPAEAAMFALVPFVYEAVLAGIEDLLCMSGDPLAPNTEISGSNVCTGAVCVRSCPCRD